MSKSKLIEEYILEKIESKEFKPESKIPTEVELMKQFQVSKMTVNKVLSKLRDMGYIYSIRGKGTFVKKQIMHKRLNELISFTEEMNRKGIKPITKTIEFSYISVGYESEKALLQLNDDDIIYKLVRLRYLEDVPMALDITFLNEKIIGTFELSKMGSSLYRFLQDDLGIQLQYSTQKIRAEKASPYIAKHLGISTDAPVLRISGLTYDIHNNPIELVHTYYVHDAYEFEQVSTIGGM